MRRVVTALVLHISPPPHALAPAPVPINYILFRQHLPSTHTRINHVFPLSIMPCSASALGSVDSLGGSVVATSGGPRSPGPGPSGSPVRVGVEDYQVMVSNTASDTSASIVLASNYPGQGVSGEAGGAGAGWARLWMCAIVGWLRVLSGL